MKYLALILFFVSFYSKASTLVLIGGGKRPASALKFFVEKKVTGPLYVLPWGTRYPIESFESIKKELEAVGATDIRCFCDENFSDSDRLALLNAGGIYFPGGNQNKVMEKIFMYDLKELITDLYKTGVPVAGTSAGTAIQSNPMLTGNGSETSEGLGLLEGFIVDQHFLVRGRQQRLLGALEDNQNFHGLGVDEDMSVVYEDSVFTALGPTIVTFYIKTHQGLKTVELKNGESFWFN